MNKETIYRIFHEINRACCEAVGDRTQYPWDYAKDWQKEATKEGVEYLLSYPDATYAALHEKWMNDKIADGWKYGPEKDAEYKEHPCLVPFNILPVYQQEKDIILHAFIRGVQSEGVLEL